MTQLTDARLIQFGGVNKTITTIRNIIFDWKRFKFKYKLLPITADFSERIFIYIKINIRAILLFVL